MEDVGFVLEGQPERMAFPAAGNQEAVYMAPLKTDEQTILVPMMDILSGSGVSVVPSITERRIEYAFAFHARWFFFSCDKLEDGSLANIVIASNNEPQIMTSRIAEYLDGRVYLPLEDMERWTGVVFSFSEEDQAYTVILPEEGVSQ